MLNEFERLLSKTLDESLTANEQIQLDKILEARPDLKEKYQAVAGMDDILSGFGDAFKSLPADRKPRPL